jgi:replicative DNA helicase
MDFEASLIISLLLDQTEFNRFIALKPTANDFDNDESKKAYSFIMEYLDKYTKMPDVELVKSVSRLKCEEVNTEASYLVEQFVNRRLFRKTNEAVDRCYSALQKNDPQAAFRMLESFVDLTKGSDVYTPPVSMFELGDKVVDSIENAKGGETGYQFPWPTLTKATNGMFAGTVTMYVARPGTGKTFVAVLQARKSWLDEKRVLLISPEMDSEEIAERFFVIDSKVSYGRVVQGSVTDFEIKKIKNRVAETKKLEGMWILDGEDSCDPMKIESAVKMLQPDIVCIDASYMLEFKGRNEKEQIDAMFKWARKAAKKLNIAIVLFHQLSREAEKDKKQGGGARMGTIALTDKAAWDCYNIFALVQDTDMRADKRMKIRAVKIRRPACWFEEMEVHWNFDDMVFDELKRGDASKSKPLNQYADDEDPPF